MREMRCAIHPSSQLRAPVCDIREFGLDAFTFEILEVLETTSEMTSRQIEQDLEALESLSRERLSGTALYA